MSIIDDINNGQPRHTSSNYPQALYDVLEVLGHKNDHIAFVLTNDNNQIVHVRVEWSVRCCDQSEDYKIPYEVLQASDPKKAAKKWQLNNDLDETMYSLSNAESMLKHYQGKIANLTKQIEEL